MKKIIENTNIIKRTERGQAIILIAFAFIGLVAMVGLVTDTGLLLIEYGKLKRSVDAAAVAAAQEFRPDPDTGDLNIAAMENAALSLLQINQMNNLRDVVVHTCEDTGADRPTLCNPDPVGNPIENRKLVEVNAVADVSFAFLRVLGITGTELHISSVGEAATIDLVLLIDTSGSMAYETGNEDRSENPPENADIPTRSGPDDDPRACNQADNCEPMRAVKDVALDFVDSLIYFGYDRVAVIAMTGQATNINDAVERNPVSVLPLDFDRNDILHAIDTLKVYQPRVCPSGGYTDTEGECLQYINGTFNRAVCETFQYRITHPETAMRATADPSSCPSSNIGGMLKLAQNAYSGNGNPDNQRTDSLWVTVLLASGPANATDPDPDHDHQNGFCPQNTWLYHLLDAPRPQWCRDAYPDIRHKASDPLVNYENPTSHEIMNISLYDAEDYARDKADNLAAMKSGNGVTIYTIGLSESVKKEANGDIGSGTGEAEHTLMYIAREAGDDLNSNINHGEYFYAPDNVTLRNIFEIIAQNIATKISE
jgi:hypothetical protein